MNPIFMDGAFPASDAYLNAVNNVDPVAVALFALLGTVIILAIATWDIWSSWRKK